MHAGQAGDADVFAFEGQFGVNLIGDHDQVMLHCQIGYGLQFLARHRTAGGVGREIENEHLALVRDRRLDGGGGDAKLFLRPAFHRDGYSVGQRDGRRVAHITGFVIDHFIARID